MNKLFSYIEKLINGEKIKGIYVTQMEIYVLIDIYNDIMKGGKPTFINATVKRVLDICNIETIPCGIGWRVK